MSPILRVIVVLFLSFQIESISFGASNYNPDPDSTTSGVAANFDSSLISQRFFTWHQMFTNIPSDYVSFFNKTFSVDAAPALLTVCGLTAALFLVDQQGFNRSYLLAQRSSANHKISDFSVKVGDGKYQLLGAALFAAHGLIFNDETAVRTGSNIVEAVLSNGLFVQVLKRMTGRQSPAASTEKNGDWTPFPSLKSYQKNQPAYYSFPSGHLSSATAVLTVIANNYPDSKWIKPVGYPLLGLLGVSLVSKGMHWYSDLPLAYFLGYSFGNIVAPEIKLHPKDNETYSVKIFPALTDNGMQLGMTYSF